MIPRRIVSGHSLTLPDDPHKKLILLNSGKTLREQKVNQKQDRKCLSTRRNSRSLPRPEEAETPRETQKPSQPSHTVKKQTTHIKHRTKEANSDRHKQDAKSLECQNKR